MSYFAASLFFFFAYVICAILLCGDLTAPLSDVAGHNGRSGVWMLFFLGSLVAAALVASPVITPMVWPEFRAALFMVAWMCLSATSAGIYGTWQLEKAIAEFHADKLVQHSFFRSLHEVPREFQFYIHAAVLKDCKPYIWSYTTLHFFPLKPDTAVNVLPQDWLEACNIKRT